MGLFGVLVLLAVAPPIAPTLLEARSSTPLVAFNTCFAKAQERNGAAWAYMPSERGGTFTDAGARGAAASYWLQVRTLGQATSMRLVADADSNALLSVSRAVEQCR